MKLYIIIALVIISALFGAGLWAYFNQGKAKELMSKLQEIIKSQDFRNTVLEAMRYIEQNLIGTELGQKRLLYVCGFIHDMLPKELQPFVTADLLAGIVNDLFEEFAVEKDGHRVIE